MSAEPLIRPPAAIQFETAADAEAIDRIVMAAFGPGRYAKTAERLREFVTPAVGFVAHDDHVIGSVRLWSITIGDEAAVFLGPIAVSRDSRREGVGADLVSACLDWAETRGLGILLVGDAPYFGRFGFEAARGPVLPGPVDQRRLLWRPAPGVSGGAAPQGVVKPA